MRGYILSEVTAIEDNSKAYRVRFPSLRYLAFPSACTVPSIAKVSHDTNAGRDNSVYIHYYHRSAAGAKGCGWARVRKGKESRARSQAPVSDSS